VGKLDAPFTQSLQADVSPELWRRVTFKPHLTPQQVAEELSTATMMIFPTRADVSPNAVKEAVVAGVPVVGSAVGGLLDYVFPGRNGLLFPSGDLEELAKAIRAACRHPLFSHGEVEAGTLREVRGYLSPRLMGKKFLSAYRSAVGEGCR
jgi:glycosyltransferase involved in cell wall biosynthesis